MLGRYLKGIGNARLSEVDYVGVCIGQMAG